ncbi:hypothetical protein LAZ67_3005242 [Cordylochernes scorpioides]|uniref:C2H2-type domain-containing protein n=1 Tax=Cordylochernes scorpioides TaxID=51811 RepID=A0ABY6KAL1_9ARAC|nr:hypothetical protein LAZ67_3005242 [Cordylochernes scorpioides]
MTTKVPGKVMETCKYCDYQTQNMGLLIVHEMTHTGEKEFRCDWKGCNYRSNQKYCVKQHKFTHTKEKPFSCEHCNYTSALKVYMKIHVQKHISKPYICDKCNFETSYCNSLKRDKRYKHTDPALKCKLCKYVACGEADLRIHACNESLCCGVCGYKTHIKLNFIRHQEVHNTALYSCSLCGKKSKSKPYFTKHMKDKHKIQKINIEEYVTPATTSSDKTHTRYKFIRHKEVHNTLPYSCSLCRTRSKSKTYFTAHMKNKHQVLNIKIEEYVTPVTTSLDK